MMLYFTLLKSVRSGKFSKVNELELKQEEKQKEIFYFMIKEIIKPQKLVIKTSPVYSIEQAKMNHHNELCKKEILVY